jgi:hypothetical protein
MAAKVNLLHQLRDRATALHKKLNRDVKEAKNYNWIDAREFSDTYGMFVTDSVYPIEERLNDLWEKYTANPSPVYLSMMLMVYPDLEDAKVTVARIIHEWSGRVSVKQWSHIRNDFIKYLKKINKPNSFNSAHALNEHKRAARARIEMGMAEYEGDDRVHEQMIRDLHDTAVKFYEGLEAYKNELSLAGQKVYKPEDEEDFKGNMEVILQNLVNTAAEVEEALYYYYNAPDPGAIHRVMDFYKDIERYYESAKRLESDVVETVSSKARQEARVATREAVRAIIRMTQDAIKKFQVRYGTGTRASFKYEREFRRSDEGDDEGGAPR